LLIIRKIKSKRDAVNKIIIFSLGFSFVMICFIYWLLINNSFYDWFLQSIRTAYSTGRIIGKDYSVWNLMITDLSNPIWLILPATTLFLFISSLINLQHKKRSTKLLFFSIIGLFSFLQYYPIADSNHSYWASTPAIGLFFYFLFIYPIPLLLKNRNIYSKIIAILFISFCLYSLFPEIKYRLTEGFKRTTKNYVQIQNPKLLQGMLVVKPEAIFYSDLSNEINHYLQINKGKNYLYLGSNGLYTTLTNKAVGIGPLYMNFSGSASGIYQYYDHKIENYIKDHKPLLLIEQRNMIKGYREIRSWKEKQLILAAPIQDNP
jgi:hypothetical protein